MRLSKWLKRIGLAKPKKTLIRISADSRGYSITAPCDAEAIGKITEFLHRSGLEFRYAGRANQGESYLVQKLPKDQEQKFVQALIDNGFEIQ